MGGGDEVVPDLPPANVTVNVPMTPILAKTILMLAVMIKGEKDLPEGPLYMAIMTKLPDIALDDFQTAVNLLVDKGIVKRSGAHLLSDAKA